jgi:uncharacterized membrane protein YqgA involved in biofilm formation
MPPMRGTLLHTATVTVGSIVGLAVGHSIPDAYKAVALHGLGLVTLGIGISVFLHSKNPLITAISISVGGVLGLALGIHEGITHFAEWARVHLGATSGSTFAQGLVTSFVLFCVGPMTLLGCLQDALEQKIHLLAVKSTLDGIAAVFLAAAMGYGVLVTAILVLIFQGILTLTARRLKPIVDEEGAIDELSGAGGAILLATGLGLLEITDLHSANYLPAIFIAPAIVLISRRMPKLTFGGTK